MSLKLYHSEYNPSGLSGTVGGDISSNEYSGFWSEVISYTTAPPTGTTGLTQYRKIYLKNETSANRTQIRVWLDAVEHPSQIKIALASGTDSLSDPTGNLSGYTWTAPANYINGLDIGSLGTGEYTGIWIQQTLSGISSGDNYAAFRLYIGAL